jgi:hypothetical protein
MFARIKARWKLILDWIKEFPERRPYTISTVIEEESRLDDIDIKRSNRAIVNYQYLVHMAEARKKGREEWVRLQQQRNQGSANNVKPLPVLEHARSKRQA